MRAAASNRPVFAALGPVSKVPPAPRRLARHLAALSHRPNTTRYADDAPPCDAPHQTPRRPPCGRTTGLLTQALAVAVAVLATGCGIRPTSVPVDAGSAPSRAECAPGGPSPAASPGDGETLRTVYLVCGSQLAPVPRSVPEDLAGRELAARLLTELEREPGEDEEQAGYSTAVSGLRVADRISGDPAGAVRLSRDPQGLGSPMLAQIVCTFAAGEERTAVLAGPEAGDPPYTYRCTDDALRAPENTVGEPAA